MQDRAYIWFYPTQGSDLSAKIDSFGHSAAAQSHTWFFRYLALYVAQFLSALLAVFAMYLVCRAMRLSPAVTLFAPVVVILLVPYIFTLYYDYLELALVALAVWAALCFDWWWLLPIAALGAWNKESFLFVIPSLYPFLRQRASRKTALIAVAVLCLVCGLIYLDARARFPYNPNTSAWIQWRQHVFPLFDLHTQLFVNDEIYGLRTPRISTLAPTLLLLWTFARVWKRLPAVVRQHGLIALAINYPLYLLFCSAGEYRNLSLLSILFLIVIAWNLQDGLDAAQHSIAAPAASS